MTDTTEENYEGGCTCKTIRYRVTSAPLFVHCCHCRSCQRETGSAFAINALIETERLHLLKGQADVVHTPSFSGQGQEILRCPACRIALWSHYAGSGRAIAFLRTGTLDDPDLFSPDIHIFTDTKLPWIVLPKDKPQCRKYYELSDYWPPESLKRRQNALA